jgi:hypothetical protein|tara:strand:+ start:197 stop:517 length:321 start_codon:yes stop_codon:yes gene_type:complete
MKNYKLSDSGARGWFIGNFPEAVLKTKDFEVCYQTNLRGHVASHIHHEITEVTLIASGRALTNGKIYTAGDIYIMEPGDISQTEYLEETSVITVKTPSIPSDKELL